MKREIEPDFIGIPCTGKNTIKSKQLEVDAKAMQLLSDFYKLDRKSQLLMAALTTEMTNDR